MSPVFATNGGLSGAKRNTSTLAASGMWMLEEQNLAKRAGLWPVVTTTLTTRYLRFANFAATTLNDDTLDLAEIQFYNVDTVLTGITTTMNFTFTGGNSGAGLTDGSLTGRYYREAWNASYRSTATISFDLGSVKTVTSTEIYIYYENNFGPRFPATFDVLVSSDGTNYTTYATLSKGTSTLYSGDVYKTAKLAL
jgi:hypothetical protein